MIETDMVKIFKNVSGVEQNLLGILVSDGEQIRVSTNLWLKLASDERMLNLIETGQILIGNSHDFFNATAGLKYAKTLTVDNFSYNKIDTETIVLVGKNQQMRVFGEMSVVGDGELFLDGDIVISDK
jgi:hypothetical protein